MILLQHAVRLVVREPRRSVVAVTGVAIASALVTCVLLFGAASGSTVTRRALADLAVDAQVILGPSADAAGARAIVEADAAIRAVSAFEIAHFDNAATNRSGTSTQTSVGVLLGIDPAYTSTTGLFGLSSGSLAPGEIAISRDLASNLGTVPGDSIAFSLPGGATITLRVSGIASIAGADLILGPIDAAHRAAGANPPTNVAVMRLTDLESKVLSKIPANAAATDPATGGSPGSGTTGPIFAPEPAVRRELHVQLDHAQLPGDPVAAQGWLDTVRRRVEREGAGTFAWVDDAGASLEPLAADLVWGQILFIFLALPGILLALALSRLAADATADTTRRHAALLRARGANRRQLRLVFVGGTMLTALVGSVIGVALGASVGLALFGGELASVGAVGAILRSGLLAVVLTTILATLTAVLPLRAQLDEEIAAGRQELQRSRPPLWRRLYLDLVGLAAGVAVYLLAGSIHPVLSAEGNPTVTLALTSFVAPLLLWAGGALLLLRVVAAFLRRSGRLGGAFGRLLGPGGALAVRSLTARVAATSRAIVVLALAVGFATSILIFDATYRQQQLVDAELTLGADLKATPASTTSSSAVAHLAGTHIAGATPFVDWVVYVGPEAQDLLAIDAATLPAVAPLADSFFAGTTSAGAIDALRARPDAILVSAETAKDYSMVPGDRIRVRVPDATSTLVSIEFTMVGIALEFPTAPKDAFLVANLSYVVAQTANDRISFVLARADGDVGQASAALAHRLGAGWQVTDLGSTTARLANSITSVDLSSLVLLDLAFGVLIAAVGVGLFLVAGLAERRRELATLIAIGAEPAQLRSSVIGEALFIAVAGLVGGLLTGGVVGVALLQILAGVFDPPPDLPAIPLAGIGAMTAAIAAALIASLAVAERGLSRLSVVAALRER